MKSKNNMNLFVKYLTNSMTEKEKIDFEKWLSDSSENKNQFLTVKKYWETSGKVFDKLEPNSQSAWNKVYKNTIGKKSVHINNNSYKLNKVIRIAATILLLISLGILGKYIFNKTQDYNNELLIYSSGDNIREIILADSTIVWLNTNSELKVMANYLKRNRKVNLSGEAFFNVAKNPEKPFLIKTDRTITKVLGTSFNIKETSNDIVLTVESGKVEFHELYRKRNGVYLTKGLKANYSKTTEIFNTSNNTNLNYLSWKTGKIEFKNTPLKIVCEQLSEIYAEKIICSVPLANKHCITGTFTNVSLEEILEVIELTINVKFIINKDTIVIK